MIIKYLDSSRQDAAWWRRYYRISFPQGRAAAKRQLLKSIAVLLENPFLGRPVEDFDLRHLPIPNTPFLLIYRVRNQTVEVVRIWDSRQ